LAGVRDWRLLFPGSCHVRGERFGDFRFLIRDRSSNFTTSFDAVFQATGTTIVRTAVQAPRMNAICERLIGTLRRELLDRTLILNQAHLRAVLPEYQEHYNTARPHRGIDQRVPDPGPAPRVTAANLGTCQIRRKPVLSGLIKRIRASRLKTEKAQVKAGILFSSGTAWTTQQARNLIMDLGDQADRVKFMIRDRGSNFTTAFDAVLADAGIQTVLCSVRTPRLNAITERWIGGCRRELLDRTLIWNQNHLQRILSDYETHHNQHRPHRFLHGAALLKPLAEPVNLDQYRVRKHAHVGGLINEYRLVA
jgi:transposase InsO family protein